MIKIILIYRKPHLLCFNGKSNVQGWDLSGRGRCNLKFLKPPDGLVLVSSQESVPGIMHRWIDMVDDGTVEIHAHVSTVQ